MVNGLPNAQTKQWSGPGNAYVETSVYLKLIAGKQPPVQVLDFPNEAAFPGDAVDVKFPCGAVPIALADRWLC